MITTEFYQFYIQSLHSCKKQVQVPSCDCPASMAPGPAPSSLLPTLMALLTSGGMWFYFCPLMFRWTSYRAFDFCPSVPSAIIFLHLLLLLISSPPSPSAPSPPSPPSPLSPPSTLLTPVPPSSLSPLSPLSPVNPVTPIIFVTPVNLVTLVTFARIQIQSR